MNRLIHGAVCASALLGCAAHATGYTIPVTGFSVTDTQPWQGSCSNTNIPSYCLVTPLLDAYLDVVVPGDASGSYTSYISADFYVNGIRRSGFNIGDASTSVGYGLAYAIVSVGNGSAFIYGRDSAASPTGLYAFYEGSNFRVVTSLIDSGVQTYTYEIFATLGTPTVSTVPEPATPALMLAGLSLFGLARKARRR